jgi:cell division protein FtsQ
MARRSSAGIALPLPSPASRNGASLVRYGFTTGIIALLVITAVILFGRIEQFVITNPRLVLPPLADGATSSPNFRVFGLEHASEAEAVNVFARDFGRSLYLCPIADRRLGLLAIDWVKEASVARVWPNSLVIRVQERVPVAFAQVSGSDGNARFALIDEDGALMNPYKAGEFNFPVLTGLRSTDTREERRERVKRLMKLKKELGPLMDKISEVDASDLENLKVTQQFGNRAYTLMIGDQHFAQRLENFTSNIDEIRKRLSENSTYLDLRLPDRVISVSGGKPNGK